MAQQEEGHLWEVCKRPWVLVTLLERGCFWE